MSTTSFLNVSSTCESNDKIDTYILVCSAILEPLTDTELLLFSVTLWCVLDTQSEFKNYKTDWKNGQEEDAYSLIYTLKDIWNSQGSEQSKITKFNKLRKF